ncbi:MAG: hypothetical protein WCL70_00770 [Paludibacter sp.]
MEPTIAQKGPFNADLEAGKTIIGAAVVKVSINHFAMDHPGEQDSPRCHLLPKKLVLRICADVNTTKILFTAMELITRCSLIHHFSYLCSGIRFYFYKIEIIFLR